MRTGSLRILRSANKEEAYFFFIHAHTHTYIYRRFKFLYQNRIYLYTLFPSIRIYSVTKFLLRDSSGDRWWTNESSGEKKIL